ncbi:MAG: triphosphoribosyl-dephospho-CoA synthase CitG [Selenomonas sp.]|nr:triphosphoribosyl-dephospho-CoA synthase CitG [Selenomonas sp.]MCR5758236.1 triphosphoribosyl-dephospho-CoA synthase CitG [Selenomonas sp.]
MIRQERIGALAVEAMLYEVSASPKPGLVDRHNNGAHHDMDFFTFMSSAAALRGYFDVCAAIGSNAGTDDVPSFLPALQQAGQKAEEDMFAMTSGINTHKGLIFSLGILSACTGYIAARKQALTVDQICKAAAALCKGICQKAYGSLSAKPEGQRTKGEKMYLRYGVTGVRGEAEAGFPSVRNISLPVYRALRQADVLLNDALVDTLLALMAGMDDTNILGRHDWHTSEQVKTMAQKAADLGGMQTPAGQEAIRQLDERFIQDWISPGGSADLLAATHFLYEIERAEE